MLTGVYVANVTPFQDGPRYRLDGDAYVEHVRWLAGHGVQGIIPFGTNGEGPSVTAEEMVGVLERLVEAEVGVEIVPAVMRTSLQEARELLAAMNDLPARAVMVLPPYYFKPATAAGLRAYYELVLEVSAHPVLAYHIPKCPCPCRRTSSPTRACGA